jgi:hypothetical protein
VTNSLRIFATALSLVVGVAGYGTAVAQTDGNPTQVERGALTQLPDWSGIWIPDVPDQRLQVLGNPAPWTLEAEKNISCINRM